MDASQTELDGFTDLASVLLWAGVGQAVATVALRALGRPSEFRHLALMASAVVRAAVNALQIQDPTPPGQQQAPAPRPISPVEVAQVESVWRQCVLKCGRDPDGPSTAPPPPLRSS